MIILEAISGITFTILWYLPLLMLIGLGVAWCVDKLVLDVTDGDVKAGICSKFYENSGVEKFMDWLEEYDDNFSVFATPLVIFCCYVATLVHLILNYLEGDEEKFEFFLFWTYNLGAFLTPIIILLLSLFTARTFAKVVYKLGKKVNKLNKALQEHVEDASMHNIKDK